MGIEQKGWKNFFESKRSVLLLLLIAIVSSTLYVVYLERTQQLPYDYLNNYLKNQDKRWEIQYFITVFFKYFKKCLWIWLLGVFTFMIPISIALVYVYIFSYGFSIAWLYVAYGLQGLRTGWLLFGGQGVLMSVCLLCLVSDILQTKHVFGQKEGLKYFVYILRAGAVCGVVTLLEMIVNI